MTAKGHRVFLGGGDKNVPKLDSDDSYTTLRMY